MTKELKEETWHICKLGIFLDENKEFQETKEYKFIAKDTQRIKNEFINNCMIKK